MPTQWDLMKQLDEQEEKNVSSLKTPNQSKRAVDDLLHTADMPIDFSEEDCTRVKLNILSLMKTRTCPKDVCELVHNILITSRCVPDHLEHVRVAYRKEIGDATAAKLYQKRQPHDYQVTAVCKVSSRLSKWTYDQVCYSLPWRARLWQAQHDFFTPAYVFAVRDMGCLKTE